MGKGQLLRLYEDSRRSGTCGAGDPNRGCGAALDWYITVNERPMPMNAGAVPVKSKNHPDSGKVVAFFDVSDSHWGTCPKREQFKR